MLSWTRLDLDIEALKHVAELADKHRVHAAVAVAALASGISGSAFWVTLFTVIVAVLLWLDLQSMRRQCLACREKVESIEVPLKDLCKRKSVLQCKLEAAQLRLRHAEDARDSLNTKLQQYPSHSIQSNSSESSVGENGVPIEMPLPPTPQRRARKVLRVNSMYALQKVDLSQLQQACEALITCVRWAHSSAEDFTASGCRGKEQNLEQKPKSSASVSEADQAGLGRCESALSLDCNVPQEGSLFPMPSSNSTTPARSAPASPSVTFRDVPSAQESSFETLQQQQAQTGDPEQISQEEEQIEHRTEEDDVDDEEDDDEETTSVQRIAFSMGSRGVRGVRPAARCEREQVASPGATTGMTSTMSGISSAMGTEAISSVLESLQGTVDSSFATFKDTVSRHWSFGSRE